MAFTRVSICRYTVSFTRLKCTINVKRRNFAHKRNRERECVCMCVRVRERKEFSFIFLVIIILIRLNKYVWKKDHLPRSEILYIYIYIKKEKRITQIKIKNNKRLRDVNDGWIFVREDRALIIRNFTVYSRN